MAETEILDRHIALIELGAPVSTGGKSGLVYESTALKLLGISRTELRKLCEPADYVDNPHYKSGPQARLYDPRTLVSLRTQPKPKTIKKPVDYAAKFEKRYSSRESPEVLAEAAEALWNLNRYAKHNSCKPSNKNEIYKLKNALLQKLCMLGYLAARGTHTIDSDAECWDCRGGGCERCGFTGEYQRAKKKLHFVVLSFAFEEGRTYTWHQPRHLCNWKIPDARVLPTGDWEPEGEKAVEMPRSGFAQAKALIRWVTSSESI